MTINLVQEVYTFKKKLTYRTNGLIVPIAENIPGRISTGRLNTNLLVIKNLFIKDFWAKSIIKSIQEADPLIFSDADTESMRRKKMLDLEWKSERKHLDLYLAVGADNWDSVGTSSLLNNYGYPYTTYNVQEMWSFSSPMELGKYARIGIGTNDAGYGNLMQSSINTIPDDSVLIYGNYTEEIAILDNSEVSKAIKDALYPDPYKNPRIYQHVQTETNLVWTVNHNFGRDIAGIRIVSNSGDEKTGTVKRISENTIEVTFTQPYSGVATLI